MPMFEIVRSLVEDDRITDFVAIGNLIDGNAISKHAAFIIKHNDELFEFHYTGEIIEFEKIGRDYYHKITDTIDPEEVPAFIAKCKNIQKKAKPIYGYFYSGESYDIDGNHIGDPILGQRMTCVGFCLNVLKGFLEEDYLIYTDWTSETHDSKDYVELYCKENKIDPEDIIDSHRRITPRECLTSCYFTNLPISKKQIDNKIVQVNGVFETLHIISNN